MFKEKNWLPNTHHKFVFVLCNKAQPSGEICFCITKEDTYNNSNSNSNSNCTWKNFSSNSKKIQTKITIALVQICLPSPRRNNKIQTTIPIALPQICLPIPRRHKKIQTKIPIALGQICHLILGRHNYIQTTIPIILDKVAQIFLQWSRNKTKVFMNPIGTLKKLKHVCARCFCFKLLHFFLTMR
jgi:hypothetical protein